MISRISYPRLHALSLINVNDWITFKDTFVKMANNKDIRLCKDYIEVEGVQILNKESLIAYFNLDTPEIPISSFDSLLNDVKNINDFNNLSELLKTKYSYNGIFRYGQNTIRINKRNFKYKREFISYLSSAILFEDIISSSECYNIIQEGDAVIIDERCYISSGRATYDNYREAEIPICGYIYYDKIIWKSINEKFFKQIGDSYILTGNRNEKCFYPTKIVNGKIVKEVQSSNDA